jgi:hypothetical protein
MSESTLWKIMWSIAGIGIVLMVAPLIVIVPLVVTLLFIGSGM